MGLPAVLLFFREYGQTSGHFVHKLGCGRGTGAFIYAQSADETSPALAAFAPASTALFSCRFKRSCPPRWQRRLKRQRRQSVEHTTLCYAKSCAKGCPFGNPAQRVTASPVPTGRKRGTISSPPIVPLLLSHSACRLPNLNVPQYFLIGCQPKIQFLFFYSIRSRTARGNAFIKI